MPKYDLIVIGSGLAGVHAAYTPVERGLRVLMLDVGAVAAAQKEDDATNTFEEVRKTDSEQYRIFLGDDLSGIDAFVSDKGHGAAMTSGRRAYVTEGAEVYGPIKRNGTEVTQSFARGGLSEVWSGVSDIFDDGELSAAGMPAYSTMKKYYSNVIERIGVSGVFDGLHLQPPPNLDDNARELLTRYSARQNTINDAGFEIKQPLYAMLTEDTNGRKAQSYRDMDFWDNSGRTLYRARYTLEDLEKRANFTYVSGVLVHRVTDDAESVTITAHEIKNGDQRAFTARAVIVTAGAINTTRLLLRSFERYNIRAPIILKNYCAVPFLFPARLGKRGDSKRYSYSQLAVHSLEKVNGMGQVYAQLLNYKSLLLYKLLSYIPLPVPEAFSILSFLAPALVLADIRFPSVADPDHGAILQKTSEGDQLVMEYPENEETARIQKRKIDDVKRVLRRLGLIPLATIRNPYGGASHYAGGVPFSSEPTEGLTINKKGQVHGHERIFVGDSAGWKALPAKPSGLTIMANADRIGECAVHFLN